MKKALLVIFIIVGWTSFLFAQGGNFSSGTVMLDNVTGDAGAAINTAFATYSVVEVTAPNPTATTLVTIPKGGTLIIRGLGTFTNVGVLFTDSITDYTGTGVLECPEGATIKLANSVNVAAVSQVHFLNLTGTSSQYGLSGVRILGCIIDGNKSNNSIGVGIQVYGRGLKIENVTVQNTANHCYWLENGEASSYTVPGDDATQSVAHFKGINCGGSGVYIPAGQGWVLTDGTTWGTGAWGLYVLGSVGMNYFNTFLNGTGGCYIGSNGAIQGSGVICTNAAGWGLLVDSGSGSNQMSAGTYGCNGCIGMEVRATHQLITGQVVNSTIGAKFNGGGGVFSLVGFQNTTDFVCTSIEGVSIIDFYSFNTAGTVFDPSTCGSSAPTNTTSQWRWGTPGNNGAQLASSFSTTGGYPLNFPAGPANGVLAVATSTPTPTPTPTPLSLIHI